MRLSREFFLRDAEIVARELLGKILVRKIKKKEKKARIVETEAYFDENDPASRACKNGDLKETMKMQAGTILVYGVHNNWLVNIVTGVEGWASAVLIRAVEPLNFDERCSGPGLLTRALKIGKEFHKKNILNDREIWIENLSRKANSTSLFCSSSPNSKKSKEFGDCNSIFEICESFRVGVARDLPRKLRFFIKGNKWVSR